MRKISLAILSSAVLLFIASPFSFAQYESPYMATADSERDISLDLKGMDIVEVLKTLALKGNMNIVVGSNVRGRVTMFLKDVDVKDAFEIILLANNLASDRRGDIIYVMTEKDYEQLYGEKYGNKKEVRIIQLKYAKVAEVNKSLNQIKTKIGRVIADEASNTIVIIDAPQAIVKALEFIDMVDKPTSTRIFELNYAKAEDVKEKIQEILTKNVGSIQIDERTNKVVITDLVDRMPEVESVLAAFDAKQQQVLIEAKIVEITLNDTYKLGVDWEAVIKKLHKEITIQNGFKLAASGGLVPGGEILLGTLGTGEYSAMVQALKTIGDVNTLSSPRITVMNNEEAKILIGTSEPYATNLVTQGTSTTTTATELTFIDIGVKLYVTPTINNKGFIKMKIRPEVSNSTDTYTYGDPPTTVPVISTTHAETSVMVKDGATIVIAGLIKDERSNTTDQIPFLGDIPVLGLAFKRTQKEVEKKELVIFLTPHIISGEVDYLELPPSPPLGEERFTMAEQPTFDRRTPYKMSPEYLKPVSEQKKVRKLAGEPLREKINSESPADYFYNIKEKIMSAISVPTKDSQMQPGDKVKVSFSLYSGGNLASKPEITESTNNHFSDLVIEAVEKSAPFPRFPLTIKESKRNFNLHIIYEPD